MTKAMEWRTAPNVSYFWLPHSKYYVNLPIIQNGIWFKKFVPYCVCQLSLLIF